VTSVDQIWETVSADEENLKVGRRLAGEKSAFPDKDHE
jgi:hypothetical protein